VSEGPAERTIDGSWYRLAVRDDGPVAWLRDTDGRPWAELRLLASVDRVGQPDETLGLHGPEVTTTAGGTRLTWTLESSAWTAKRLVVDATAAGLAVHVEVDGDGPLGEVRLLGGRAVMPASGGGLLHSGAWFETLFCPSPTHPLRIIKPASESAVIGVVSGSEPGRGNWFFTPAPLVVAASREAIVDSTVIPAGPWLWFGLGAGIADATMPAFCWDAIDRGFSFRLDYEGKTAVGGTWRSPSIVIGESPDPYAAIAAHGAWLRDAGLVPTPHRSTAAPPDWWRQPIFCGWGAQCRLALDAGLGFRGAPGFATQAAYDGFLDHLAGHGIVPGTIVIDDKWQAGYGTCLPDDTKWPDLRGWIARRRDGGQRILLWWKAWDAEGLPAEWCVRSATGAPLGLDPTHPDGREAIRAAVRTMLAPDALDADGLKIDFTARTPSGTATRHHGRAWGIALLHELLAVVAEEAKRVKPDALLVGHTPNPLFADVVDMIRLNDTLRLDDPEPRVDVLPQMRHRAAVSRAALPDHLVDTDDWCAPDLATWRRFLDSKPELGVPALYYATGVDLSGEDFGEDDYAAVRRVWAAYREGAGLADPGRDG
jgi:hypothetical protein